MNPVLVPTMVQPSWPTTVVFVVIVLGLCVWLVTATGQAGRALGDTPEQVRQSRVRATAGSLLWLGGTALISAARLLETPRLPPPLALFVVASVGVPLLLALSPFGTRLVRGLPIAALVTVQGFRLPLELVLHAWKTQGVLPVQMTFEGRNFDIVTGVLALGLGLWLRKRRPPRAAIWIFNLVGFALLVNVASIAMLSSPLPIRQYLNDPPVLLAFHFPYGWILPFCVGGALFAHVLTFRWLVSSRQPSETPTIMPSAPATR